MRKRNHTVTIRMNNEEYNLLQNKVKESGRTQQEVVIKGNRRFEDNFYRGSGRTEKIEPDVCRYSQSASWSYYKYQSDCKKAAYRWRSSK